MSYAGGVVTELAVQRVGPRTVEFSFKVPDDGLGNGAAVEVRGATVEKGDWWWGSVPGLAQLPHGSVAPGTVVTGLVADTGLDLDGRSMHFRAVAFRFDEATGKNVFSAITPAEPGLRVDFDVWEEPAEPDPPPPVQPFGPMEDPVAGDTGVVLGGTFVDAGDGTPVDLRFWMPDENAEAWYRQGTEPGESFSVFLPSGRTLTEGEVLQFQVQSQRRSDGVMSALHPDPPMQVTVRAAPATDPVPDPEPGFPATTVAEFPTNSDEFYLDMPDGRRMKFGRLWKWLSVGWFGVFGVYIGREE